MCLQLKKGIQKVKSSFCYCRMLFIHWKTKQLVYTTIHWLAVNMPNNAIVGIFGRLNEMTQNDIFLKQISTPSHFLISFLLHILFFYVYNLCIFAVLPKPQRYLPQMNWQDVWSTGVAGTHRLSTQSTSAQSLPKDDNNETD